MNLNIIIKDDLSPDLAALRDRLERRRPLHAALAGHLARDLRDHFTRRDRQGNKKGWPRRHFWNKEGRQNTAVTEISETGATVAIASPAIAHKVMGGTIRAKRSRNLAIPVTAQAYAAGSPREGRIPDLFFARTRRGGGLLAQRQGRRLITHYILKPSVYQPRDPNALPPPADLDAAIQRQTEAWLRAHVPQ